jgi:hypothetical protein
MGGADEVEVLQVRKKDQLASGQMGQAVTVGGPDVSLFCWKVGGVVWLGGSLT